MKALFILSAIVLLGACTTTESRPDYNYRAVHHGDFAKP